MAVADVAIERIARTRIAGALARVWDTYWLRLTFFLLLVWSGSADMMADV